MTLRNPFSLTRALPSLCLCLIACGPEDKKDDGGGFESTGVTADAQCAAECDWMQRCPDPAVTSPTREECITTCRARTGTAPVYRKDYIEAVAGCFQTLACGVSNDTCSNQAVLVVSPSPADDPLVKACLAQHEACDTTGSSFREDVCGVRLLLIASAQAAFDVCVSKACAEIDPCIDVIMGRPQ